MTRLPGTVAPPGVLLLAHGAAGSVRGNFGPLLTALSARIPVAGPDFPGSGTAPRAGGPLELDDLSDRLIAAAGDEPHVAILGYSMGCAVAVRTAVRHPDRVSGLVLTAGSPRLDPHTRARIERWRRLADGDRAALAAYVVSVMTSEAFLRQLTDTQLGKLVDLIEATVPDGTPEQVDLVRRIDVTGELADVAAPTLVIGTAYDRLIAPSAMREYAEGIPGARWAQVASGHAVSLEAPGPWLRLVEEFLTGLAGESPST